MKIARRGLRSGALWFSIKGAAGGSVFAVIFVGVLVGAVEIFEESIVYGRLADDIFLARPVAEVEELAAFAAEWKFRDGGGVRRFLADGAAEFHAVKNTAKRNRCGVRVFFSGPKHSDFIFGRYHQATGPKLDFFPRE